METERDKKIHRNGKRWIYMMIRRERDVKRRRREERVSKTEEIARDGGKRRDG